MSIETNDLCVARFATWVAKQRKQSFDRYRSTLHRNLSAQRRQHLTQQAILDTAAALFRDALEMLYELPFDSRGVSVERGWSALTLRILEPFQGFCEALLDDALRFSPSSCGISNFAAEHLPRVDSHLEMRRELASAWRDFALTANDLLVETNQDAMASLAA